MVTPHLILSPDGSRDAAGSVSPPVLGAVSVVAGRYGQAWSNFTSTANVVTIPTNRTGIVTGQPFTILLRGRVATVTPTTTTDRQIIMSDGTSVTIRREEPNGYWGIHATPAVAFPTGPANGAYISVAYRFNGSTIDFFDGATKHVTASTVGALATTLRFGSVSGGQVWKGEIESVLFVASAPSDSEVTRLLAMPQAWTWASVQARRIFPILKVGSQQRIGPLRAGKA